MEVVRGISLLLSLYKQSDYCPSLSKVVKSVACVAGAILGWRYAPKAAMTLVSGAALYYGVWKSPPPQILIVPEPPALQSDIIDGPSAPEATSGEALPVYSEFKSLKDAEAWIADYLKNPGAPRDLVPLMTFLHAQCPQELNILDWRPCIPGFAGFQEKLNQQTGFERAMTMFAMTQTPGAAEGIAALLEQLGGEVSNGVMADAMKNLGHESPEALTSQISVAINNAMKASLPDLTRETDLMAMIFFLSAALHKQPAAAKSLILRLKPLEESEEILKNKQLRAFILKILFLSQDSEFEAVLKQINPGKFEQSMKTVFNKKHPLDAIELQPHSYIHFLACQQWYKATQEPRYLSLADNLRKIVTAFERVTSLQEGLIQISGVNSFFKLLLKSFLCKAIHNSNLLPLDLFATFPVFFNQTTT